MRFRELANARGLDPSTPHLNLAYAQISDLSGLEDFRNLEYLDLSHNRISQIPPMWTFTRLHYLDLSYNQIRQLPALPMSLKTVKLAFNSIDDIAAFFRLPVLNHLDLRSNRIAVIDPQWQAKLFYLDLRLNNLKEVPEWDGFAQTLLLDSPPEDEI